jgi:transposase
MVYLTGYQLLPYDERASELLKDLSLASLLRGRQNALLGPKEKLCGIGGDGGSDLKEGLIGAGVGHFDETGLRVGGKGMWVHPRRAPPSLPTLRRSPEARR